MLSYQTLSENIFISELDFIFFNSNFLHSLLLRCFRFQGPPSSCLFTISTFSHYMAFYLGLAGKLGNEAYDTRQEEKEGRADRTPAAEHAQGSFCSNCPFSSPLEEDSVMSYIWK